MLNRKTYYGIQALLFLAKEKKGNLIPINTMALSLKISRKFLEKILSDIKSRRNNELKNRQRIYAWLYLRFVAW